MKRFFCLLLALPLLLSAGIAIAASPAIVEVISGGGAMNPETLQPPYPPATQVHFNNWSSHVGYDGFLYVPEDRYGSPDYYGFVRVNPSGIVDRVFLRYDPAWLEGSYVNDVGTDRDGNVFIVIRPFVRKFGLDGGMAEFSFTDDYAKTLCVDRYGQCYAGTAGGRIWRINPDNSVTSVFYDPNVTSVSAIWADDEGDIYFIATDLNAERSIRLFDRLGQLSTVVPDLNIEHTLTGDRWGNIYFVKIDETDHWILHKRTPDGSISSVVDLTASFGPVVDFSRASVDRDGQVCITTYYDPDEAGHVLRIRQAPVIRNIDPAEGAPGSRATLHGSYFSGDAAGGTVKFTLNGTATEAAVLDWSNEAIVVQVPNLQSNKTYQVTVTNALGQVSDPISFKITRP